MSKNWYNAFNGGNMPAALQQEFSTYWPGSSMPIVEINNYSTYETLSTTRSLKRVFAEYSPIAAIITKMAAMSLNGCFEIVDRANNNYLKGKNRQWDKLFDRPNPFQTRSEFFAQLEAYVLVNGWCYVEPLYSENFPDIPYEMYIIPPEYMTVEPVKQAPRNANPSNFRKLKFTYNGMNEPLDETKLILFKDAGSPFFDENTWLPESRLKYLKFPISNGKGSMESMNTLITDRGASGIISNTSSDTLGIIDIDPAEKQSMQDYYKRNYGLTRGKRSSILITNAAVKYQPMTFNVQELMLHEQHASSIKDICAMYHFPARLLVISEGATYNNQNEDKKSAYQDCLVPNSIARMEQWNVGLNTIDKNIKLIQTFEHLAVMQETELQRGRGMTALNNALEILWRNGGITMNEWFARLGWDTVEPNNPESFYNKRITELTPEEINVIQKKGVNNMPTNNPDNNATAIQ